MAQNEKRHRLGYSSVQADAVLPALPDWYVIYVIRTLEMIHMTLNKTKKFRCRVGLSSIALRIKVWNIDHQIRLDATCPIPGRPLDGLQ